MTDLTFSIRPYGRVLDDCANEDPFFVPQIAARVAEPGRLTELAIMNRDHTPAERAEWDALTKEEL